MVRSKYEARPLTLLLLAGAVGVLALAALAAAKERSGSHDKRGDRHEESAGKGGEVGYSRTRHGHGKRGYQMFDSFHNRDSDAYAFEKHDSVGHAEKDGHALHSQPQPVTVAVPQLVLSRSVRAASSEQLEEQQQEQQEQPQEQQEEQQEQQEEEEEEPGGGHDEADVRNYQLPARYTYGEAHPDDPYDF